MLTEVLLWIHVACACSGFVIAGGLGIAALRARKRNHGELSLSFWRWQRVVQGITVVLAGAGIGLYLSGRRPSDPLHLLYGALALLTILLQGATGPDRDLRDFFPGLRVKPVWIIFGLNAFLWAMYGRGLSTGFFGV